MRIFRMVALFVFIFLFIIAGQALAQNPAGRRISHANCDEVLVVMPQAPEGLEGTTVTLHVVGPDGSTDIVLNFQGYNGPTAKWVGTVPNLGNGTYTFSGVDNELTAELNCWEDPGDDDDDDTGDDDDDTGDDDDDDVCPWDPQLPVDSDECQPPGDDDDDTGDDDDDVEYCPYNRQLPIDSPECVPSGDDDDDDGPTPGCSCRDGVYGCYTPGTEPQATVVTYYFDANNNGQEDPGESVTAATCFAPPPAQPGEGETGLFDEEESEVDPKIVGVALAIVALLVFLTFMYLRSGNPEQ